jgi:hypothetical protein
MDLLKKLLGEGIPAWAQPLSPKHFADFHVQILATFSALKKQPEIDWKLGKAKIDSLEMYFHNLLAYWREAEATARHGLVQEFIESSLQAIPTKNQKLSKRLDDILPRIYDFEIPHIGNFVSKSIGNFLFATLVIDSPTSTISVTQDQFQESNMSIDELFDIAKKNLRAKVKPETIQRNGPLGELITVTAEFFGASFITILEPATKAGETYWVSTPNRHMMLLLKPNTQDEESLQKFLELSNRYSNQLPNDYILPFVLEYKDGVFRDLCIRVDGGIEIA